MKTLAELLADVDAAKRAVDGYDMTNHYAYLKWSAADRIEFDVNYAKARNRLHAAQDAYREAIEQAARQDTP